MGGSGEFRDERTSRDSIATIMRLVKGDAPAVEISARAYHASMFTCNIDQRGKTFRLVMGALLESVGMLLGALWYLELAPSWTIWPALAVWVSGLFVIFEAVVGWCAVRAMGLKTPI